MNPSFFTTHGSDNGSRTEKNMLEQMILVTTFFAYPFPLDIYIYIFFFFPFPDRVPSGRPCPPFAPLAPPRQPSSLLYNVVRLICTADYLQLVPNVCSRTLLESEFSLCTICSRTIKNWPDSLSLSFYLPRKCNSERNPYLSSLLPK